MPKSFTDEVQTWDPGGRRRWLIANPDVKQGCQMTDMHMSWTVEICNPLLAPHYRISCRWFHHFVTTQAIWQHWPNSRWKPPAVSWRERFIVSDDCSAESHSKKQREAPNSLILEFQWRSLQDVFFPTAFVGFWTKHFKPLSLFNLQLFTRLKQIRKGWQRSQVFVERWNLLKFNFDSMPQRGKCKNAVSWRLSSSASSSMGGTNHHQGSCCSNRQDCRRQIFRSDGTGGRLISWAFPLHIVRKEEKQTSSVQMNLCPSFRNEIGLLWSEHRIGHRVARRWQKWNFKALILFAESTCTSFGWRAGAKCNDDWSLFEMQDQGMKFHCGALQLKCLHPEGKFWTCSKIWQTEDGLRRQDCD